MRPDKRERRPCPWGDVQKVGKQQHDETIVSPRCRVCGQPDDNLSTLGRCWSCIQRASDTQTSRVMAWRKAHPVPAPDVKVFRRGGRR